MSYVILDLEWNGSYSKTTHRYINEIIEFGAVKTDDDFNIIDEFSTLIKPQIGKKLCGKVKELTKITNEELKDEGMPFLKAVSEFTEFSGGSVLMTWGTSDILALVDNYRYYTGKFRLPFLKKYCNIQEYCESCLGLHDPSSQLGLSSCAEKVGIEFSEDAHHRAFSDAEISLKCLSHFTDACSLTPFIVNAQNDEFYDRMMFKNHFITDINSPDVDEKQMRFVCYECGRLADRTSNWKIRNNSFTADFVCRECGKKFLGRVSFKKKYDCVVIKKRITLPKQKEDSESTALNGT